MAFKISVLVFRILFFIWELPQNILGVVVFIFFGIRRQILGVGFERERLFIKTRRTGVSLGSFVFWTTRGERFPHIKNDIKQHEYGHTIQSRMFGPLYLLLVGIPSISRVIYSLLYYRRHKRHWKGYFNGYPEDWADRLGKVRQV